VSVGYLIYDRLYETEATITAALPTDQSPAVFLFTINNNSHLFKITDVRWNCFVEHLVTTSGTEINMSGRFNGSERKILAGHNLNVDCNAKQDTSTFLGFKSSDTIAEGTIWIEISYDTDLRFWKLHRSPPPTKFTWFAQGTARQWIKGDFAK
jgi:hypothetical protein